MREILFQGKLAINNEWAFSRCPDGLIHSGVVGYDFIPETVGQFTGFTDCRKAKLFEHDVVTAKFKRNGARFNFKIIFRDGCFLFDNGCVAVRFDEIRSAMKIGNIHDNPELLKGGAKDG